MSCPFTHEELEDHANGRLEETRARELEAHVAGCSSCRDELDWLCLERMAFEERKAGSEDQTATLWAGIEERLSREPADIGTAGGRGPATAARLGRAQRAAWFGSGFAAAAMAAAVLMLYLRAPNVADPRPAVPAVDAGAAVRAAPVAPAPADPASAALDEAEAQYAKAIAALEADFTARRPELPDAVADAHAQAFEHSRELIDAARRDAGDDLDARMLVLDAYSAHLHTVQSAMSSLE